jgi:nitric oxide reductase activation protein
VKQAVAEPPSTTASLAAQQPVLALFAQAIAGRTVALREGSGAATSQTGRPNSAPTTITLPTQITWFANERDNRGAYRIAVMRQALAVHGDDALQAALAEGSVSWRRVWRSLERLRIDAAIANAYPGARADLTRQRTHDLAQRQEPSRRWPLKQALDALWRHAMGDPMAAADSPVMRAVLRDADTLSTQNDTDPLVSARVATRICATLGIPALAKHRARAGSTVVGAPDALGVPGPNPSDSGDAAAVNAALGDGAQLASEQVDGSAHGSAIGANHAAQRGGASSITASRAAATAPRGPLTSTQSDPSTARRLPHSDDQPAGRAHPIDEWDYRQQRLLSDWCTLIEGRLHGSDTAFIHTVRRRHAELARRVRRQFAAWRPEGLRRVHGASDGDELELDRVIEAMVDRRAGLFDDRAWYVRRDRAQRDVATAFLVDTSASTDFVLPDATVGPPRPAPSVQAGAVYLYDLALSAPPPEPPKRRVIDVAKDALALMCDALHTLGDCFAVYTFSGHGRTQVDFRIVKSFDEAVSSRTAAAIASLRPHGATRTGAAIRHATAHLVRQSQRQRVLIVVTDGYPEDIDYGPEPRDLRYGLEDTAHALLEAQALGVHTFCLSIDPAGHDYLRRMCPPRRYGVLKDLAALPGELAKVYQAMTRATHDE